MAKFDPFLFLDCAGLEGAGAQSKERKGSNFAVQRSGAIVQKPEGPTTRSTTCGAPVGGGLAPGGRRRMEAPPGALATPTLLVPGRERPAVPS